MLRDEGREESSASKRESKGKGDGNNSKLISRVTISNSKPAKLSNSNDRYKETSNNRYGSSGARRPNSSAKLNSNARPSNNNRERYSNSSVKSRYALLSSASSSK